MRRIIIVNAVPFEQAPLVGTSPDFLEPRPVAPQGNIGQPAAADAKRRSADDAWGSPARQPQKSWKFHRRARWRRFGWPRLFSPA